MSRRSNSVDNVETPESRIPSGGLDTFDYFDTYHLKADLRRRSVQGGVLALASQGTRYALTLITTAVLARLLTPQDYGLVAMATALTAFVFLFREMGLSTATIQKAEVNHGQISTLFWINFGFGILMALLLVALARPIAWFYEAPQLTNVVMVLSLGMPLGAVAVQHRALLLRQMRFGALGAIEVGSVLIGAATGIALAWRGAGYFALILMLVTTELVSAIGVWTACGWRPGPPRRGSGVRGMLGFGGNLTGFNIMNYLARNLDNVLIGKFLGPGSLGLYSRAYALLMMPLRQLNAPLGSVAIPSLSRLADSPERYRRAYCSIVQKIQMISLPAIAFLMVCADWVILLVLGPRWSAAAGIFVFLGLAGIIQPLTNTSGWLFVTQGRGRDMLRWGVVGGSLSVASFLIGLPWGTHGVAAAYGISGPLVRAPLLLWYVSRRGPVTQSDLYRTLALPSLAALSLAVAISIFRQLAPIESPWTGLGASGLIAIALSLAVYAAHGDGRRNLVELKTLLVELGGAGQAGGSGAPRYGESRVVDEVEGSVAKK